MASKRTALGFSLIAAGFALGAATMYFVAPKPMHHEIIDGKGHVNCVRILPQEAELIVRKELHQRTIPILKSHFPQDTSSISIEAPTTSTTGYNFVISIKNSEYIWQLDVDHLTGIIGKAGREKSISKERAAELALVEFDRKTNDYVRENAPSIALKKSIQSVDFLTNGLCVTITIEGQDAVWLFFLSPSGSIENVWRECELSASVQR